MVIFPLIRNLTFFLDFIANESTRNNDIIKTLIDLRVPVLWRTDLEILIRNERFFLEFIVRVDLDLDVVNIKLLSTLFVDVLKLELVQVSDQLPVIGRMNILWNLELQPLYLRLFLLGPRYAMLRERFDLEVDSLIVGILELSHVDLIYELYVYLNQFLATALVTDCQINIYLLARVYHALLHPLNYLCTSPRETPEVQLIE